MKKIIVLSLILLSSAAFAGGSNGVVKRFLEMQSHQQILNKIGKSLLTCNEDINRLQEGIGQAQGNLARMHGQDKRDQGSYYETLYTNGIMVLWLECPKLKTEAIQANFGIWDSLLDLDGIKAGVDDLRK